MDRKTFTERLHAASVAARDFARGFVLEVLPDEMLFRVRLNQSYDRNPLHPDVHVYPEDSVRNFSEELAGCPESEVVELLWRDNRVPEWVDISVVAETKSATIMGMRCCGRFTENDRLLYHKQGGWPPFQAVGPVLPPGYQNGQRFSIYSRCEVLKLADAQALEPQSTKVWSLELRGAGCDDHTLSNLPQFPTMELLDLTYTVTTGFGFAALDRQPNLRVLKAFVPVGQPLNLERLPQLPSLKTLMVHNAPSITFDFGSQSHRLPTLNHLDLQSRGVLTLDGRLPDSMWAVRLVGKNLSGTLTGCTNVEHLSLRLPEGNERELGIFVRHTQAVKFLDLSTTPVSDAFVTDLVNRWPLEYLEVSETKVSEKLVTELVQLRPKLRVFHREDGSAQSPSAS